MVLGLARPVGSNLGITFAGFSTYGGIQISYCHMQNINFGTSLSLFVSLAVFIINARRDMDPGAS